MAKVVRLNGLWVHLFLSGSNRKAPALAGAFFDSVLSIANEGKLIGIVDPFDGVQVRGLGGLTRVFGVMGKQAAKANAGASLRDESGEGEC